MNPAIASPVQAAWVRALPAFLLSLVLAIGLYRTTAQDIVAIWIRSDTFTHGFLVVPIVLWLVWRRRDILKAVMPKPEPWMLVMLSGAAFAWLLGELVSVNAVTQLAFVAMLVLLVPALLGFAVARQIIFPLCFLFFAVPFGEFAMPQLMVWTADFTVLAIRMSGIPVYREGLQFVIPTGNWSVIEACSGVRYLIASLTVGTLFAYLNFQSTRRRAVFIAVSILVPVIANWLRAYMIVMLGHFSGNKLATGVDHIIYGWVFFGIVILLMFMIGARWAEPETSVEIFRGKIPRLVSSDGVTSGKVHWYVMPVASILVLASVQWAHWQMDSRGAANDLSMSTPGELANGWVLSKTQPTLWDPAFQNPAGHINATYERANQTVGLYLGFYRQQNQTRKLVSSQNVWVVSKDAAWSQLPAGSRVTAFGETAVSMKTGELRANQPQQQSNEDRLVVRQIYWVNGALTANDMVAKIYGAFYKLVGQGDDSAVIIVYAHKGSFGEGDAAIEAFMKDNGGAIAAYLKNMRAQR